MAGFLGIQSKEDAIAYLREQVAAGNIYMLGCPRSPSGDFIHPAMLKVHFKSATTAQVNEFVEAFERITGMELEFDDTVLDLRVKNSVPISVQEWHRATERTIGKGILQFNSDQTLNSRALVVNKAITDFLGTLAKEGVEVRTLFPAVTNDVDGTPLARMFIDELKQKPWLKVEDDGRGRCALKFKIGKGITDNPATLENYLDQLTDKIRTLHTLAVREGYLERDDTNIGFSYNGIKRELKATETPGAGQYGLNPGNNIRAMATLLADSGVNFPGSAAYRTPLRA